VLDPPPGGLGKLRARLDADDRRAARVRRFAIPALVMAAVAAIALWLATGRTKPAEPSVATTLVPDPTVGGVAFYWVSPSQIAPSQPAASVSFVDMSAVSITP